MCRAFQQLRDVPFLCDVSVRGRTGHSLLAGLWHCPSPDSGPCSLCLTLGPVVRAGGGGAHASPPGSCVQPLVRSPGCPRQGPGVPGARLLRRSQGSRPGGVAAGKRRGPRMGRHTLQISAPGKPTSELLRWAHTVPVCCSGHFACGNTML